MTETHPPGPIEETSAAEPTEGRTFPCESCGADLVFHIGVQTLKCTYCGFQKQLATDEDDIGEQDFEAMLAHLASMRDANRHDEQGFREVDCQACGGTARFSGTLTSSECAYCGSPLQVENVHDAPHRVPVDGVLPFTVPREKAASNLRRWVQTRWFAPNEFRRRGARGAFNGLYTPYWTFDSMTSTHYTGERGEHYYVTMGTGKNRRRERRTRWYPAAGSFQRFFDDLVVMASSALSRKRARSLEPWPLKDCVSFNPELLAGLLARTYDTELSNGFGIARERIDDAILADVRNRIGGDTQRVHSVRSSYDAVTYKHLLLPVWMLAYRFRDEVYQVVINAATGEVQGDRPYSWIKITLAALAGLVASGGMALIAAMTES